MELSELRQLLGSARCFAVERAEEHNPGESGWAWSVQIVTREPNSIGGMQKMLDTALPALLAVAEKAEVFGAVDADDFADGTYPAFTLASCLLMKAALARLKEV